MRWMIGMSTTSGWSSFSKLTKSRKRSEVISVIGADAYKSLRDLCHPTLPRDKPFEDLCELLRKQFSPQIAIFRERVKFYNVRQEGYENVTQWYGRLKRLSVDCKFCGNLEAVLLDKFITGLRPGQVLDRLCEESETLKLEQALDIAVNKECAAKENAYLPYRPPLCGVNQQPRFQKCGIIAEPRLAICPPAPTGYRPQALGFDGGVGSLFGGAGSGSGAGGFSFGTAPAAQTETANNQLERAELADSAPALGACAFRAANLEQQEQQQDQQDGVPEGANRVSGAAAKGRRVRTRRRGAARRGAAGDAGDQNSVDGEQQ